MVEPLIEEFCIDVKKKKSVSKCGYDLGTESFFHLNSAVLGSGFKPALVRRDVSMKLLSHFMELGFHHHILVCQVWARGSRVTTN
jgi:hypothetical protein